MPRYLGPFDKRRQRTRCATCSALHLKCDGQYQYPCLSCRSSGRVCVRNISFGPPIRLHNATVDLTKYTPQPSGLMKSQHELCTSHFFGSFLPRNDFTARASSNAQLILKSSMHRSAGLRNVIIAIGALDLTRYQKSFLPIAAAYYKQAVSSLRLQLTMTAIVDDAVLSTSLLLALFELMFDSTGKGFMLHFTNGLPALLRERGFSYGRLESCRSLLQMVQMLEAMRAASFWSYTQPTLLEDPHWQETMQKAAGELPEDQAFAVLYVLMGRFVSLNNTLSTIVLKVASDNLTSKQRQMLLAATKEGWDLYHDLEMWHSNWIGKDSRNNSTSIFLFSEIYHCTLMISLTTIFNFPHLKDYYVPSASATALDSQVDRLCTMLSTALRDTNVAGILLLWPLRVAGAKSSRRVQACQVLDMLREIKGRGFAVAQSFEDVLVAKWKQKVFLES